MTSPFESRGQDADELLRIEALTVDFVSRAATQRALFDVSIGLRRGEILGLIGESGAGKSLLGTAVMGLMPRNARITSGRVVLNGRPISILPAKELHRLRGKELAMIFQDPQTSLNPLLTIGNQLIETIRTHTTQSHKQARAQAIDLLAEVGIAEPTVRMDAYPHEFSGGQRQRIVIALALCVEPQVIIADEPTTALDVSVQAQILRLLKQLCATRHTAILLITHDMGVIAQAADRVGVLYAGRLVEFNAVDRILLSPQHPYTAALMASIPSIVRRPQRLSQIDGTMPRLGAQFTGCAFAPRCAFVSSACDSIPALLAGEGGGGGGVACWHPRSAHAETPPAASSSPSPLTHDALSNLDDEERAYLSSLAT